nr:hypothetical protein [Microbispora sp. GKU 823]
MRTRSARAMACFSGTRAEITPGRMLARACERNSPATRGSPSPGPSQPARASARVATRSPEVVISRAGAEWSAPYIASSVLPVAQPSAVETKAVARSGMPSAGPVNRPKALPYPPGR